MLELKNIIKDYVNGDNVTHALKDISLNFRRNEFVSILGPSGCGKTTTLNIIGGLDRYTSGDLIIEGKSTKNYTDRDWDTYRNHSIGFVFQTYNLISHLSILGNVELALTIGGLSKEGRREKALEALNKVGLKDVAKKLPNQLSGGQMQRVAIARALVNDPEIVLADEPTGALDSETSIQIMDLLKEVAKDRLVIMVTHNPDLAKRYSSRIITMKDGHVIEDSNPFDGNENSVSKKPAATKKSKMSLKTSLILSAKNLISKRKRTILVCVAGSIGIIGVSTVLSVSTGVSGYIVGMEDDMLSGNPVTVSESTFDIASLLNMATLPQKKDIAEKALEYGTININYLIATLSDTKNNFEAAAIRNNINQDYVDYVESMPKDTYSAIERSYGISYKPNIFTDVTYSAPLGYQQQISLKEVEDAYVSIVQKTEFAKYSSLISNFTKIFHHMPDSEKYITNQYDILNDGGYIPREENEMMLVVSNKTELTDLFLAQAGYYTEDEFIQVIDKYVNKKEIELKPERFAYETLLNKKFYYYPNDSLFDENHGFIPELPKELAPFIYKGHFDNDEKLPETRKELKITAIVRAKPSVSYGSLETGFVVSKKMDEMMVRESKSSKLIEKLKVDLAAYSKLTPDERKAKYDTTKLISVSPYFSKYCYENQVFDLNATAYQILYLEGSTSSSSIIQQVLGNVSGEAQFESTIREFAGNELPNSYSFYPLSFKDKYLVTDYLDAWNSDGDIVISKGETQKVIPAADRKNVRYNDSLEIIINLLNNLIQIVTVALVSFTSLSLVVSTVMIGIITYVSVVERVKEIGIIRSLGGRKLDVSNLFNAETFIIGLISGLFGILVTYGLSGIINIVINVFAKVGAIVYLPWNYAIIIVAISIGLTLISGLLPARIAAHKDPVVALRSND